MPLTDLAGEQVRHVPPSWTLCADCGCCPAALYAGEGDLRAAICNACDEGVVCAPKKHATVLGALRPDERAALDAKLANISEPTPVLAAPEPVTPPPTHDNPEPEPEVTTMAELTCIGGCGTAVNKPGFAWGHKNGCERKPKKTSEAEEAPDPEADTEAASLPEVAMNFTEPQLDRIWASLPIEEKALAVLTALNAERE